MEKVKDVEATPAEPLTWNEIHEACSEAKWIGGFVNNFRDNKSGKNAIIITHGEWQGRSRYASYFPWADRRNVEQLQWDQTYSIPSGFWKFEQTCFVLRKLLFSVHWAWMNWSRACKLLLIWWRTGVNEHPMDPSTQVWHYHQRGPTDTFSMQLSCNGAIIHTWLLVFAFVPCAASCWHNLHRIVLTSSSNPMSPIIAPQKIVYLLKSSWSFFLNGPISL